MEYYEHYTLSQHRFKIYIFKLALSQRRAHRQALLG